MIDGVVVTPLRQIGDQRGKVMHMLRSNSPVFEAFGEIYFSCVNPGWVKGWHRHSRMTLNYAVPHGAIRFVLYDGRETSATRGEVQEIHMGPDDPQSYVLVTVPPLIWNGFQGLAAFPSIVANCATIPHDPDEIERLDPHDESVPYAWKHAAP